jgi:ribosomal protein L11 methyltransferase
VPPARSIRIAPRWHVVQPGCAADEGSIPLRLGAGPGFGDGAHPTTQLCLQAISALSPRGRPFRVLDFGSGSGILSIAAARLGASVEAVEIDEQAIEHAARNLASNGVEALVRQHLTLDEAAGLFDVVIANILRHVLLSFAVPLAERVAPGGILVLSGLVSTDVPELSATYTPLFDGARPSVHERDEWRALVWKSRAPARR